jgi:hypothetical protein
MTINEGDTVVTEHGTGTVTERFIGSATGSPMIAVAIGESIRVLFVDEVRLT